jgi:integrase/recombinase XerC/integrase/recombinase XerD
MSNSITQEKAYHLPDLINYYELCNRAEGKSPKTITWYTANLRRFYIYLKNRHLPDSIGELDIMLLREYIIYLLKSNKYEHHPHTPIQSDLLSTSTVHGHIRTLRAFFGWLVREGISETNIAKDLKPPKLVKKVVSILSDEEIVTILNTLNLHNHSQVRNKTIFILLLDTGLRIGELINLKMEDVHLNDGYLKVIGKGKKERMVPMGTKAQRELQRYIFRYRPKPAYTSINNVFLSVYGKPLTENSIKLMFARLARISGVNRLHAHLCRHTFATRFLINGGDVFTLQQILGHSTLEMVRNYITLASSHVAIQHQRYSPMDRISLR